MHGTNHAGPCIGSGNPTLTFDNIEAPRRWEPCKSLQKISSAGNRIFCSSLLPPHMQIHSFTSIMRFHNAVLLVALVSLLAGNPWRVRGQIVGADCASRGPDVCRECCAYVILSICTKVICLEVLAEKILPDP